MKDYSQYGESSVLWSIFEKIGTINKFGVEFGSSDGFWLSNLRMFMENGWKGLQMEGLSSPKNDVKSAFITKENINELFDKYNVPDNFDLLSIDIDGNDYWVWKEIKKEASVVIIEYNSNFDKNTCVALEYNPQHTFDGTHAYSASFKALCKLAESKGYYLYKEMKFTNLIFVQKKFEQILSSEYDNKLILPHYQHGRNLRNKTFIEV